MNKSWGLKLEIAKREEYKYPSFLSQIDGKKRAERDGEFLTFNPIFLYTNTKKRYK
jgi:hypothetical protein